MKIKKKNYSSHFDSSHANFWPMTGSKKSFSGLSENSLGYVWALFFPNWKGPTFSFPAPGGQSYLTVTKILHVQSPENLPNSSKASPDSLLYGRFRATNLKNVLIIFLVALSFQKGFVKNISMKNLLKLKLFYKSQSAVLTRLWLKFSDLFERLVFQQLLFYGFLTPWAHF